jgi:hypothetical protein
MFTRITPTHYLIKDTNNSLSSTVHVGQVADFIKFDEQLRHHGGITSLQSMPVGFIEFAQLWNRGVRENDRRRISEVYLPEDTNEYEAQISNVPVRVTDFFITADQVGLAPPPTHADESQTEIVQEFASLMAEQRRNSRKGFGDRQDRHDRLDQQGRRPHPYNQGNQGSSSQPSTVVSRLQFKGKRRRVSPIRGQRSPSPAPSYVSELQEEELQHPEEEEGALPPAEQSNEMETSN